MKGISYYDLIQKAKLETVGSNAFRSEENFRGFLEALAETLLAESENPKLRWTLLELIREETEKSFARQFK